MSFTIFLFSGIDTKVNSPSHYSDKNTAWGPCTSGDMAVVPPGLHEAGSVFVAKLRIFPVRPVYGMGKYAEMLNKSFPMPRLPE